MLIAMQLVCSLLIAVGLFFTIIDWRTRFDRSFRYFGAALIFLSLMSAIDLWIYPGLTSAESKLYWQRILHVLACLFMPFSLNSFAILTHRPCKPVVKVVAFTSLLLAISVFLNPMLGLENGQVKAGMLYFCLFFPYVLAYIGGINFLIFSRIRVAEAAEKKLLHYHSIGFALLCLFGILDMTGWMRPSSQIMPGFKVIGMLMYGITATIIFVERFLLILRDRDATYQKLEAAYRDLEQSNGLKQLGESTAIINHEIKNYMFMIAGHAQILAEAEPLSPKGKDIVGNIVNSVERLTNFSRDILELSKTRIVKEKHSVNIGNLILNTVDKHFGDKRERFRFEGFEAEHFLHGDWAKLEQIFLNIFKNSFEAQGPEPMQIAVSVESGPSILLIAIEDNGLGCNEEQMEGLFQAFYTTKRNLGGTGLGMSIARTIVESHGGKISAYSKNLGRKGGHGLKFNITFPLYREDLGAELERKYPIVLVKEGLEGLADVIRVFQNVRITPYLIQNLDDLDPRAFPPEAMAVLASPAAVADKSYRLAEYPGIMFISQHRRHLYVLGQARNSEPELFCEDYVVNRLIKRGLPEGDLAIPLHRPQAKLA